MEEYKNEELLKKQIMEQSRHMFIYGYNTDYRSDFLKSLERDYPLMADSKQPIALYFDSLGMPKTEKKGRDPYLIESISREYLSFSIAAKILEKSMEIDRLDTRLKRLIDLTNLSRNREHKEIETARDLLDQIKTSRDFYYEKYREYVNGSIDQIPIMDITLPIMFLEHFVIPYKEAMKIDSYFAILIDKKKPLALSSIQTMNDLINGRINKDISVKVAVAPGDWDTHEDTNGQFIQYTHDYGVIELDDSNQEYIKRIKKHRGWEE